MNTKNRLPSLLVFSFLFMNTISAFAHIRLPSVISDHMILQQNSMVKLWGWADPGEQVTVIAGWEKTVFSVTAGQDGKWVITLHTPEADKKTYDIIFLGKQKLVVHDVMLGEVWFCSGQSNMEYTFRMLGGWDYYPDIKSTLSTHDYSQVRLCQVSKSMSATASDSCQATWRCADIQSVIDFSAVAFYYGKELYDHLNIPIALISSSWGGTPAQAWTDGQTLQEDSILHMYYGNLKVAYQMNPNASSVLYNAMIHPLIPFSIKGVIWYQGESNIGEADLYRHLFSSMMKGWRKAWNQGDFPFYYVQIAPFHYEDDGMNSSAYLREAQLKSMDLPNTGMVVTMDIGNTSDIHPKNKKEVGRRLALWALANTYGWTLPAVEGPVFDYMKPEGQAIRVYFKNVGKGLKCLNQPSNYFYIAGADRQFKKAEATLDLNSVLVSSADVKSPVAVRYAFNDTDASDLYNSEGLPASSFRTDTWPFCFRKPIFDILSDSLGFPEYLQIKGKIKTDESLRYSLNGENVGINSKTYERPIKLDGPVKIRAKIFTEDVECKPFAALEFNPHLGFKKKIILNSDPSVKYSGKANIIINGLYGSFNYSDGSFLAYQGNDPEFMIDLGEITEVHSVKLNFLCFTDAWIFPPESVTCGFYREKDLQDTMVIVNNPNPATSKSTYSGQIIVSANGIKSRYLKLKVKNIGNCPSWHQGRGRKAWIFIDELMVE